MQLYISSYGAYIHIKDQMFEIKIKDGEETKKHHFSAKKISSIVLEQGTAISSDAVKLAMMNNVDIVFVHWDGQPIGRVWHSKLGSTTLIRKEQLKASLNTKGLLAIKNWLGRKIDNEIEFINWLKKHREKHTDYLNDKIQRIEALNISLQQIEGNSIHKGPDTIRGLEGTAGRLFFRH